MKDEFGGLGGGVSPSLEAKKAQAAKKLAETAKRLSSTTAAVTKLSKTVSDMGKAAQKTAKALRTLMSFDEINRLAKKSVKKTAASKKKSSKSSSSGRKSSTSAGKKSGGGGKGFWEKLTGGKGLGSIKAFVQMNGVLQSLIKKIKGGLSWCYEKVLAPLGKWTLKKGVPAQLKVYSAMLHALGIELGFMGRIGEAVWKGVFVPLGQWAGDTFVKVCGQLEGGFNLIGQGLSGIKEMAEGAFDWLGSLTGGSVLEGLQKAGEGVMGWFQEHIRKPLTGQEVPVAVKPDYDRNQVDGIWSNLKEYWGGSKVLKSFVQLAKDGWTSVKSWIGSVPTLSEGVQLVKSGWSSVTAWLGKPASVNVGIGLVKKGWKSVKDWLGDLTAKFNVKLPKITVQWSGSPIKLPHFEVKWNAKGGILNGATIFGMAGSSLLGGGEAGREAVLPLERNTGWMDGLAERVARRVGGGNIVVQVTLDGKVVGQSVVNYVNGQARATGVHPMAAFL